MDGKEITHKTHFQFLGPPTFKNHEIENNLYMRSRDVYGP